MVKDDPKYTCEGCAWLKHPINDRMVFCKWWRIKVYIGSVPCDYWEEYCEPF